MKTIIDSVSEGSKINDKTFEEREKALLFRIKTLYTKKLGREITDTEVQEIASNLLGFAKSIYGM